MPRELSYIRSNIAYTIKELNECLRLCASAYEQEPDERLRINASAY